ncbi:DUF7019 family protein [Streptomyces sp. NPDC088246]|uniref:DUF7019 family protein n=1 Tax=Streptomyces sp. NPDC088246 TaxID=3365842 RepID=UPI003823417A
MWCSTRRGSTARRARRPWRAVWEFAPSSTPAVVVGLAAAFAADGAGTPESPQGMQGAEQSALAWVYTAGRLLRGPQQSVEFVARRLLSGPTATATAVQSTVRPGGNRPSGVRRRSDAAPRSTRTADRTAGRPAARLPPPG